MTAGKRLFDIVLALFLLMVGAVPLLLVVLAILVFDGRPVLFRSERMRDVDTPFVLVKFRTMSPDPQDRGVTGGDKAGRVTSIGRVLRRSRLDELPQLFNILAGDMSFFGPRPPLRAYVEARPDLYRQVLQNRPGLTGLATLVFRRHEERMLAACATAEETERVYLARCVPKKARLDLIYQRKRGFCYDLAILRRTIRWIVKL